MALQITDESIEDLLTNNKTVVIDFYADWCGPCKMLGPIVDELSSEVSDVSIGKLDISNNADSTTKYGVTSIPTIIFFTNGVEVHRIKGVISKAALKKKIDEING
jgi:thioredoxin 1